MSGLAFSWIRESELTVLVRCLDIDHEDVLTAQRPLPPRLPIALLRVSVCKSPPCVSFHGDPTLPAILTGWKTEPRLGTQ